MSHWKTTLTAAGSGFMSLVAMIAVLPYSMGDVATILPPEYKTKVCVAAAIASFILKIVNGVVAADAKKDGANTSISSVQTDPPRAIPPLPPRRPVDPESLPTTNPPKNV